MSGRPRRTLLWRGIGLAVFCILIFVVGCSSPQQRYRVLSVFFDGVPNPDAPKITAIRPDPNEPATVIHAVVLSRHKPFTEGKCNLCHRSATGEIEEFEQAYKKCVKCHTKVTNEHLRMHGPVAREACQWCHGGHESSEAHLLKESPVKVCTQCHDQQLLGNKPPEHNDKSISCLKCHFGHGGADRNFLKPVPETQPSQWPATQPAIAPQALATQPGGTP